MPLTLYAGSKTKNLKKSINEFVRGKLLGQAGYSIDWGQSGFKEEGLERWIQFRFILSTGRFMRQVDDNGRKGEIRDVFLNFNLFERYPPRKNIYWVEAMRKVVFEYFNLKAIPINDFDTVDNPLVGEMRIMAITHDGEIDGGRASGIRQWNMNFHGRILFKYL